MPTLIYANYFSKSDSFLPVHKYVISLHSRFQISNTSRGDITGITRHSYICALLHVGTRILTPARTEDLYKNLRKASIFEIVTSAAYNIIPS